MDLIALCDFCCFLGNSELKDKEDQFGRTPLMYCVLADRLDCAETLLKAGADVNRADRSRRTALHLAAQKVITLEVLCRPINLQHSQQI